MLEDLNGTTILIKRSLHDGSSSKSVSQVNNKRRTDMFHIRVVSKHTKICTLSDPGSQANLIS